jgi:oligoendopeptidase F
MTPFLSAATTPERDAIEDRFKWDLSKMYASQDKWDGHCKELESLVAGFEAKKGAVGESASSLLAALQLRDKINIQLEKLVAYAAMRRDEDMRQPASQALFQRAQTLAVKWDEASSWFQPDLLRIPDERLREFKSQPDMKVYDHYFDDLLRTKAHILSAREEELLAMAGKAMEASSDAFGLLSNTELRWRTVKDPENRDVEITSSSFTQAMQSKDRRYRQEAFTALYGSFID